MFTLSCQVQQYAWGKVGLDSVVAQLKDSTHPGEVDASEPYAEYWFGTHPKAPSDVTVPAPEAAGADGDAAVATLPLHEWLAANPDALGSVGSGYSSGTSPLPYLFKVLSIGKALSIQAHPAKKLAEELFATRPDVYKDPNHKPEMACALTPMDGMCGFRKASEIVEHLRTVPEFRAMVGEEAATAFEAAAGDAASVAAGATAGAAHGVAAALKTLFESYMTCAADVVDKQAAALAARLSAMDTSALSVADGHALRLTREYPGDVGVVAPYVLNCVHLEPGTAMFLAANEPHAYMSGDCMEVMACSDNVVRAGLTPKLRDVDTLVSMLTYRMGEPDIVAGEEVAEGVTDYKVPVPEFRMQRLDVPKGATRSLAGPPGAAILVVVQAGEGASGTCRGVTTAVKRGTILLQSAGAPAVFAAGDDGDLQLYRSHVNDEYGE